MTGQSDAARQAARARFRARLAEQPPGPEDARRVWDFLAAVRLRKARDRARAPQEGGAAR